MKLCFLHRRIHAEQRHGRVRGFGHPPTVPSENAERQCLWVHQVCDGGRDVADAAALVAVPGSRAMDRRFVQLRCLGTFCHSGQGQNAPRSLDWGLGRYESTAEQLLPAARVLIDSAALRAGERVVDLGCGTGNAALIAAGCGAQVIGVDPAARLLDVARGRAVSEGATITFLSGEAASIPVGDASADVIVSVFSVIFAPDALAAAARCPAS